MLRLDWNLLFTIVNLLIIYFLMKRFLFAPVKKILAQRQEELEKQYADARSAQDEAGELKNRYEAAVRGAEEEKLEKLSGSRIKAAAEYERIVSEARDEAEKIKAEALRAADMEQQKRLQQAQAQIADLVVAAAARITAAHNSEETDRALYNQFIAKAGEKVD